VLSDEEAKDEGFGVSSRVLGFMLLGITLILIGIAVFVVAFIVLGGSGNLGGIILIGPIPIFFGAWPEAGWLIAISIILTITSIILFLIMNRRTRRVTS
jgi:uncharacterized membrane protein